MPPLVSQSNDPLHNRLFGINDLCGHASVSAYKDRCGYRPGLPFLIISPYAKVNYVSHQIIDQTSIIRFIEHNWGLNHIGSQSLDIKAGTLLNMFDFTSGYYAKRLFLDPCTGLVKRQHYRL